jgi:hypothetical protein
MHKKGKGELIFDHPWEVGYTYAGFDEGGPSKESFLLLYLNSIGDINILSIVP